MRNTSKKTIRTNDINKHCQLVVDDFFNYVDGDVELVKYIDVTDIKDQLPPPIERVKVAFARCKRVWSDYCDYVKLPRECRLLFVTKVKVEWHKRETKQNQLGIQKRKRSHSASS